MVHLVVAVFGLLLACQQPGLILAVRIGMTPWCRICPSRVWCHLRLCFGCATRGANPVVLCSGLQSATRRAGAGASWKELQGRSMSEAAWDQPGAPR